MAHVILEAFGHGSHHLDAAGSGQQHDFALVPDGVGHGGADEKAQLVAVFHDAVFDAIAVEVDIVHDDLEALVHRLVYGVHHALGADGADDHTVVLRRDDVLHVGHLLGQELIAARIEHLHGYAGVFGCQDAAVPFREEIGVDAVRHDYGDLVFLLRLHPGRLGVRCCCHRHEQKCDDRSENHERAKQFLHLESPPRRMGFTDGSSLLRERKKTAT